MSPRLPLHQGDAIYWIGDFIGNLFTARGQQRRLGDDTHSQVTVLYDCYPPPTDPPRSRRELRFTGWGWSTAIS